MIPQKIRTRIIICSSSSTSEYISPPNKSRISKRYLYTNAHSSIIHNSQWKQHKCPLTDERIRKNVVYQYSAILFSLEKEGNYDICYYIIEPCRLCWVKQARQSKTNRVWFHLCDVSRDIKFIETQSRMGWEMRHCYLMSVKCLFCKMEKFWRWVAQQCEYIEHYWTVHLKMVNMVNVTLCVFYHNKNESIWKWLQWASLGVGGFEMSGSFPFVFSSTYMD